MKQVVKKLTRGTAILDLKLSNANSFYDDPKVLPPPDSSDHSNIVWRSKIQASNNGKTKKIATRPTKDSGFSYLKISFVGKVGQLSVIPLA